MGISTSRRTFLAGGIAVAFGGAGRAEAAAYPQVYLLRGGVVGIFSTGMNQMSDDLAQRGVKAVVQGHTNWSSVARRIMMDRSRLGPGPVVLVGHSFGADAVVKISETIRRESIPVDMLVSIAATNPDPVPSNVRRAVGYYFSRHGWGLPLVAGTGFRGKLSNRDYSDVSEVGHFNIDKQTSVQNEILQLVLWSLGK
ncbi:MAG: alpha/beta hydrolase [Rhizobiaceae bacterium]|nr:alpha/beta hydrolase [Rhizobiaceae bacterium]